MKVRRLKVTPTLEQQQIVTTTKARETLRTFAAFCEAHDPAALASEVDAVAVTSTLAHIAQIDMFFRRYAQALRQVQPQ